MTNKKMTPEAAIIELNRCKIEGYAPVDVDRRNMAIEMAKAALRKEIKEKPHPEEQYFDIGKCPSCGAVFVDETNYCGNYGQALDRGTK